MNIIIIIIIYSFFTSALVGGFYRSLSDNKSPQVSRTLLDVLADLNNAIVCMISTCPLISKSSNPCINSHSFLQEFE